MSQNSIDGMDSSRQGPVEQANLGTRTLRRRQKGGALTDYKAIESGLEALVPEDPGLLTVSKHQVVRIVTPRAFLDLPGARHGDRT
ncbi:MAG: hypothetical protein HY701_09780 [Gemmatimonadetes bacterium]|nr:hypothetical protein [Gemmatimonadota bacterium]